MPLLEIGVCTYRRAHLEATLRSVSKALLPDDVDLRVIVADNDQTPSAKPLVDHCRRETGLDIQYLHAPYKNIARARNACLEAAEGLWLAFIDDDLIVEKDCFYRLLAKLRETGAAAIFGVSLARYPENTARWIVDLDLHSDIMTSKDGYVATGYTGNALIDIRHEAVKGLEFDVSYDQGGEDTAFFHEIARRGGKMCIDYKAITHAPIDPSRLSFGWLVKRKYAAGTHVGRGLAPHIRVLALVKSLLCGTIMILMSWQGTRARFWAIRSAFHAGVFSQVCWYPRRRTKNDRP